MPSAPIAVTRIRGLSLGQDPRQLPAPALLDARNTMINLQGPYSGFADELITEDMIANPEGVFTFRVGEHIKILGEGIILCYDDITTLYYPCFQFTDSGEAYPWTMARVGNIYWFAKYGVTGLLKYNPTTDIWTIETGGDIPDTIYGVCEAAGRLVVLSDGLISWSKLDDGSDLATSLVTGAGSLSLGLVGSGEPLGVFKTANGFIVFTRTGMAAMELVNAVVPFKFKGIETQDLPINPYAIVTIEAGKIVYLSKNGFRTTTGGVPQPWQPLMGQYIVEQLFPSRDLSVNPLFRLTYYPDSQWFIVSVSSEANPFNYTRAYVLYIPLDDWGSFDQFHYAFGELDIHSGFYEGFNFGYIGSDFRARRFIDVPRREESAETDYTVTWFPAFDPQAQRGAVLIFASRARLFTDDLSAIPEDVPGVYGLNEVASVYDPESLTPVDSAAINDSYTSEDWNSITGSEDWNIDSGSEDWLSTYTELIFLSTGLGAAGFILYQWTLEASNYTSIDAWADIGLFRLTDGVTHDRLSQMNLITLGLDAQTAFTYLDYEDTFEADEDWNVLNAAEDWGDNPVSSNSFDLSIKGTIDGQETFVDNDVEPVIARSTENSITYSMSVTGLYHRVRLSAQNENQSYHLKTLEMTGILAGRYL